MRICRLAFITTTGVIMCNYWATAFAEIDERRVWRKNEGVGAETCAERDGDRNRPKGGWNLRDAEWPRRKDHDG